MKTEQIEARIAELEATKIKIQAEADRQLNYQFGRIDGQIALLQELRKEAGAGDANTT